MSERVLWQIWACKVLGAGKTATGQKAAVYDTKEQRIEPYRTRLESMWRQAQEGQFFIVRSELVVLETLVKPLREGDTVLEQIFRALLHAREVRLIPATLSLWKHAVRLPTTTGLKTPDALCRPKPGNAASASPNCVHDAVV